MTTENAEADQAAEQQASVEQAAAAAAAEAGKQEAEPAKEQGKRQTVATNGHAENGKAAEEQKPYWPEDWRKAFAKHEAPEDEKAQQRILKQLARYVDPTGIFAKARELESKFSAGGLVKLPGADAKDEDVAAFRQALGWSEKPEEMVDAIQLQNGAVIGDNDKEALNGFLGAVHGATSAKEFVDKAANWYFESQQKQAAELDEADEKAHRESKEALRSEYGAGYDRRVNSIASLFATAPGGVNLNDENSLFARLMGGRMSNGRVIGDDPDMVRFLVGLAHELYPAAAVTEGGTQSGEGIEAELNKIRDTMRSDRRRYDRDEGMQARYRELLAANEKRLARQR